MITSMATKRRQPPPVKGGGPLFLTEHMEAAGVSNSDLAKALGVAHETVWKWQKYPSRLDPLKQAQVARVLKIWPPQLWVKPGSREDRLFRSLFHDILPQYPPEAKK